MNEKVFNRRKYSNYCREHTLEFRAELLDDAALALSSWPGRTAVILLVLSSAITYFDAMSRGNEFAIFTLFAYSIPILIVALYPLASLLVSTLEKYSHFILDVFCGTVLLGFFVTLGVIFNGTDSQQELDSVYIQLLGQINFVILLCTSFSYHAEYLHTVFRNIIFAILTGYILFEINSEFLWFNRIQLVQGYLAGLMVNWIFHETNKARFYLKSTDADTRQHLHNQLSKLVYPHQLERIKLGDELEDTMPLKEGKAIVNVFDVQRSSEIRHEKTNEFFMSIFQSFLQISMEGYEHNPLRSRAFRLKETGDGFISAIGYPFLPVDSRSLADSAVSTALTMFDAFNTEVARFNYARPIKGAMGLAYNSVQGTFQSGGIRSYDLFGEALIQASKYEELRKQPLIWNLIREQAASSGLEHFNILIVQETVYNSLSPVYRDLFVEIDLNDDYLKSHSFQMMYDNDAKFVYFHVLE